MSALFKGSISDRFRFFPIVTLVGILASAQPSLASEGGLSFYLPGSVGDIVIAQSKEPGLQVANTMYFMSGKIGAAVLQGRVNTSLDVTLALDIVSAKLYVRTKNTWRNIYDRRCDPLWIRRS